MIKNVRLTINGKVQQVGYRFTCMETAYKLGIRGFVKNNHDGSVCIEAEGPEDQLEAFVAWCSKGPLWARVIGMTQEEGEVKHFKTFDILH
ncbi:MAG: acylphosphatase [Bacteroidales bacterium]|nr:acylphosphatase [Bacteroidales bacterium]